MSRLHLFSVCHKESVRPKADYVSLVQVGVSTSSRLPNMYYDNDGNDNISHLNKHFCELTALYWIWKNYPRNEVHIWGLCHYRRYFMKLAYKLTLQRRARKYFKYGQDSIDKIVTQNLSTYLEKKMEDYDVLVQYPIHANKENGVEYSIKEAYQKAHSATDWETLNQVILEKYPSYKTSLDDFNKMKSMSYYNMMIARWNIWDAYLEWLFTILFEVQKRITISDDPYQTRVFGFMSERLLNLFIMHNKLKVGYTTIALFEK